MYVYQMEKTCNMSFKKIQKKLDENRNFVGLCYNILTTIVFYS